jgi:hypothetical protein
MSWIDCKTHKILNTHIPYNKNYVKDYSQGKIYLLKSN